MDVQLGRADHPVSLAAMEWTDMNAYADAKTDVITEIKHRARVTP